MGIEKLNEYQCFMCNKIYEFENNDKWNDEKAMEEYQRDFGHEKNSSKIIVCDVCYQKTCPENNKEVYNSYLEETK